MATEDWSCSGLDALRVRMCRSSDDTAQLARDEDRLVEPFKPTFVYPIFGEEETIFGYRGLDIDYRFASGSLAQYLSVTHDSKFPPTGSVQADDPEQILYDFIPPSYAKNLDEFNATVERDAKQFRPVGQLIGSYRLAATDEGKGKGKQVDNGLPRRTWEPIPAPRQGEAQADRNDDDDDDRDRVVYEAFWSNWDTPGFKEFHRRAQIFVLLYIEGAQYIDEEDGRWEFVTLFERRRRGDAHTYHFVGYVSFYSFFCWPDTKRLRLAQFVLLPPYHGQGHGSALYDLCYRNILERSDISELTVEDPSETFEDMRDKCDLYTLISGRDLDGLNVVPTIDRAKTEAIRKKYKLADRQFYRLVEMILLLDLSGNNNRNPHSDLAASAASGPAASTHDDEEAAQQARAKRAFRLLVKKRLYVFNKEQLLQIDDADERKAKLQETFEGVVDDYERLTDKFRRTTTTTNRGPGVRGARN